MIKVNYTELDGPAGPTCRLEASGHAGYAPAGQDIVCAGASTLMQTLCALLAGEEGTRSGVWDEPDGPRLAVTAAAPQKPWVEGAFEFAKAGFALLAERDPDNVRFAALSGRGEQSMVDLQMFAEGDAAAPSAPALSHAQAQQAIASGTMKADEGREASDVPTPAAVQEPEERPAPPERPAPLPPIPGLREGANTVRALHARWAAEEAMLRRDMPDFSLKQELANPEMRRLMELPGMRMGDAYRPDRGAGRRGAHPSAFGPPGGKRHQPRRCGHHPGRCGQHDPRPARGTGTPCDARGEDQFLTSHRVGLTSSAPRGAPLVGEPRIDE